MLWPWRRHTPSVRSSLSVGAMDAVIVLGYCRCRGLGLCPTLAWIFRCRDPPDLTRAVRSWPWSTSFVRDLLCGSSFGPRGSDLRHLLPQPVVIVGWILCGWICVGAAVGWPATRLRLVFSEVS
jgi:hypothetical protein